jgi:hypothetical protein
MRSQLVSLAPKGSVKATDWAEVLEKLPRVHELVHAYDRASPSTSLAMTVTEVGEPSTMYPGVATRSVTAGQVLKRTLKSDWPWPLLAET